ncbi:MULTISPECIES: (2Fe-2S)-binding protein [Piscirickettsiaceae]|jgi:NAD(P)H-nitrite reductase large subunit|uniref:(2Fe-2S)-binding protein n=1 Tax=Hydrogenovibrio thermophilus TaxID=265883 RepID=A0A410H1M0_9GAMM|nr:MULTISPECIES: (2Fe-2S)-binding protein [Piscirickettsiaceae]AZR82652.1 (2Fe-2S)-binding protein [Thiomicrospira sp. S5]QAB14782.1 (2Fe-2S)-binding protein [Hydrogenovibrio thermophilus]
MKQSTLDKLPDILQKDLDENLCVCNGILKRDIIDAIEAGADTLDAVRNQTYATDGNGCCKRQVQRLVECLTSES